MTPDLTKFILELLVSRQERILLRSLMDNPTDPAIRAAYGDWLEEQGRDEAAKLIRRGWSPGENITGNMSFGSFGSVASGYIRFPFNLNPVSHSGHVSTTINY